MSRRRARPTSPSSHTPGGGGGLDQSLVLPSTRGLFAVVQPWTLRALGINPGRRGSERGPGDTQAVESNFDSPPYVSLASGVPTRVDPRPSSLGSVSVGDPRLPGRSVGAGEASPRRRSGAVSVAAEGRAGFDFTWGREVGAVSRGRGVGRGGPKSRIWDLKVCPTRAPTTVGFVVGSTAGMFTGLFRADAQWVSPQWVSPDRARYMSPLLASCECRSPRERVRPACRPRLRCGRGVGP